MAPKPNGFMVFALEYKSKHKLHRLQEAIAQAGEIWKNMSAQQRGPYNEQAKREKCQTKAEKLTCHGTPLSLVDKEKNELEQRERDMKRYIESTVKNSVRREDLPNQKFHFIMVNYFSKSIEGGVYVPAELSLSEFSLANGVNKTYHSYINPGVVIYGHTYEAKQHSESTHNLPLPPRAFGEKKMGLIYNDIVNFIRTDHNGEYPPLYTDKEQIPIVESVLKFMLSDDGAKGVPLRIYSIQYLFYILKEATCQIGELPKPESVFITDAYFERDYFEFQTGIACQYHEKEDRSKYCTLSCVIRWGYIFAEYMCNDIAINLVPGKHIPITTNFEAVKSIKQDEETSCVSMLTETTHHSKPLPGRVDFYDDQKSYISDTTILTASDFPKLSSHGKKRSNDFKDAPKINMQKLEDEANPWSTRSQKIPKEPDSSFFKLEIEKKADDDDLEDIHSVSSFGRGRGLIRNRQTGGLGRGRILDA